MDRPDIPAGRVSSERRVQARSGLTPPTGQERGRDLSAAHAKLAEAERRRQAGDLKRARALCEALLEQHTAYVGALQTLGLVELAVKDYWRALSYLHQAAIHCPRDPVNLANLAAAYLGLGALEPAEDALGKAEALAPDDPAVHWTRAETHRANRDYLRAAESYAAVLRKMPGSAEAAHALGDCNIQLGQISEASEALGRAHALKPESAAILYALTQLPSLAGGVNLLEALERARPQPGQERNDFEVLVAFAGAAALDRIGRHEEAWRNLLEANGREFPRHREAWLRHRARMNIAREAARRQDVIKRNAGLERSGSGEAPLSLFIVGSSRSGKTVLEGLVALLEGVRRGFESRVVEPAVRRASQLSGLLTINDLSDLPRSLDRRFSQFYADDIRRFARGARIVTDTHPGMITAVGRVAETIPSARFVFIRRDRFEAALRIFMKPYRRGNHYSYDIAAIFDHLACCDEMIDLWSEKLPDRAITVSYEDVVADPEATLARVAELCGSDMPSGLRPELGDDRGCARPYRPLIEAALKQAQDKDQWDAAD